MDAEAVRAIGDKWNSNERLYFFRDGKCRIVLQQDGKTVISEGSWRATEKGNGTLSVEFHRNKVSTRASNGSTKQEDPATSQHWLVTMVEPDLLLVSSIVANVGRSQHFAWRRVKGR